MTLKEAHELQRREPICETFRDRFKFCVNVKN